jgi:hypothetical protein
MKISDFSEVMELVNETDALETRHSDTVSEKMKISDFSEVIELE